jgi:hypothetical protein
MDCPICKKPTTITLTKGPGRHLSGYALSAVGAMLEIPEEIEIPVCECGTRVINEQLGKELHAFERNATKRDAPIDIL